MDLELWSRLSILYLFGLHIKSVITVSVLFGGYSIDLQCKSIDWFLCDLDALIEVYNPDLLYVLCILLIYLFALYYLGFCLLTLLILLLSFLMLLLLIGFLIHSIVVVLVLLRILPFYRLSVLYLLCCHCLLEPY